MSQDKVIIFDTTLRDGEQSAGTSMSVEEKLEIARQLARLKVDVIEAGFAASSPGDFLAIQTIAEEVKETVIASLARALPNDIDKAWESIKGAAEPRIHVFISSSDIHIIHQLQKNPEEVMEQATSMVRRAKGYCSNVEFSPMDASRTGTKFLYQMLEEVIRAGATTVNIPDTVGYAIPSAFGQLIRDIRTNVDNIEKAVISVHCHNDLGLSTANSLAAVEAGARQVEGCINGIGERAGNAALEEMIMALHTRRDHFDMNIGVDTTRLYPTSRLVSRITGMSVQPNKSIVGGNAFRHSSGIHQDAILKERTTFELMAPKSVGWPRSELVLGKLSGRAGLSSRLEDLGYKLNQKELDRVFKAFKDLADNKREVTDRDLEALMAEEKRTTQDDIIFKLDHVQFSSGDHDIPTATVRVVAHDGHMYSEAATGNGPVDAVCNAIQKVVNLPVKLVDFNIQSITEGMDAMGEVTIRVERGARVYLGLGTSTDVVVASAKAYVAALNRVISIEGIDKRSTSNSDST